jgi:hypothetical protein
VSPLQCPAFRPAGPNPAHLVFLLLPAVFIFRHWRVGISALRGSGGGESGQGGSTAAGGAATVVCSATAGATAATSRLSVRGGATVHFLLGKRHCLNPNRALGTLMGGGVANPALARLSIFSFGAAAALSAPTASAAASSTRVVDTIFGRISKRMDAATARS